jgi:single-stranded-DNA-specific exonuclease
VVRHGLVRLCRTTDAGLAALLEVCGLKDRAIVAEDVGFQIGPRINAAGRLGAAGRVIDLLGTDLMPDAAANLAAYLHHCNLTRQRTERAILGAARAQGAEQVAEGRAAVVVAAEDWHPGVIGIVASRLVERFGRPALVVSFGTRSGVGYGSGRSIPGLELHKALEVCMPHLVSGGGHAMAAGFKVEPGKLDDFRRAFWSYCETRYGGPPPPPPLVVEAEAEIGQMTIDTVRDLARLEPHGAANPRPFFLLRGCRVERSKLIGERQDHLSLTVSHPGPKTNQIRCVGFGMGERIEEARGFVDVVGVPRINDWMGRRSVEMEIKDFRRSPATR